MQLQVQGPGPTASFRGVSLSDIGRHSAALHCARALGRRRSLRQQGRVGTRGLALALELCERPWRQLLWELRVSSQPLGACQRQERALARRPGASLVSDQQLSAWRPKRTCYDTPATTPLRRGCQLMTLQPTKRQPATNDEVERGGRVTTARRTTTRAAQGCTPHPHTHAGNALRQLTMHISTNDLHCCKPARMLQWAPSGGRPRCRPPATAPPRSDPPHQ